MQFFVALLLLLSPFLTILVFTLFNVQMLTKLFKLVLIHTLDHLDQLLLLLCTCVLLCLGITRLFRLLSKSSI